MFSFFTGDTTDTKEQLETKIEEFASNLKTELKNSHHELKNFLTESIRESKNEFVEFKNQILNYIKLNKEPDSFQNKNDIVNQPINVMNSTDKKIENISIIQDIEKMTKRFNYIENECKKFIDFPKEASLFFENINESYSKLTDKFIGYDEKFKNIEVLKVEMEKLKKLNDSFDGFEKKSQDTIKAMYNYNLELKSINENFNKFQDRAESYFKKIDLLLNQKHDFSIEFESKFNEKLIMINNTINGSINLSEIKIEEKLVEIKSSIEKNQKNSENRNQSLLKEINEKLENQKLINDKITEEVVKKFDFENNRYNNIQENINKIELKIHEKYEILNITIKEIHDKLISNIFTDEIFKTIQEKIIEIEKKIFEKVESSQTNIGEDIDKLTNQIHKYEKKVDEIIISMDQYKSSIDNNFKTYQRKNDKSFKEINDLHKKLFNNNPHPGNKINDEITEKIQKLNSDIDSKIDVKLNNQKEEIEKIRENFCKSLIECNQKISELSDKKDILNDNKNENVQKKFIDNKLNDGFQYHLDEMEKLQKILDNYIGEN